MLVSFKSEIGSSNQSDSTLFKVDLNPNSSFRLGATQLGERSSPITRIWSDAIARLGFRLGSPLSKACWIKPWLRMAWSTTHLGLVTWFNTTKFEWLIMPLMDARSFLHEYRRQGGPWVLDMQCWTRPLHGIGILRGFFQEAVSANKHLPPLHRFPGSPVIILHLADSSLVPWTTNEAPSFRMMGCKLTPDPSRASKTGER